MSSRNLLRLILLVQAIGALAIGLAALHLFGANRWQALAAGLLSVILVRMAINANNFRMSARSASPTPPQFQLGLAGRLRLFLEEFTASMLNSSWYMTRVRDCTRIYSGSSVPPVLLVHGYGCNSGYWSRLLPLLDAARISHAALDLEPLTGDIDSYAAQIEDAVTRLCDKTGAQRVTIIGHSMGGLAGRAWMRAYGTTRLARLITLGSPHHGTSMAVFGVGINALQMRRISPAGPECEWLRQLGASETPATRALITSIYTHHDNIVAPQTSSELPGARNLAFGGVGHVALGSNPRVLAAVMDEVTRQRLEQAHTSLS
jgi:pimeloyl-ACP methyl ester carboxylesterase